MSLLKKSIFVVCIGLFLLFLVFLLGSNVSIEMYNQRVFSYQNHVAHLLFDHYNVHGEFPKNLEGVLSRPFFTLFRPIKLVYTLSSNKKDFTLVAKGGGNFVVYCKPNWGEFAVAPNDFRGFACIGGFAYCKPSQTVSGFPTYKDTVVFTPTDMWPDIESCTH